MSTSEIGLIGLGTMGAMLAMNIAEKGFAISVFNRTTSKTDDFMALAAREPGDLASRLTPTKALEELVASIAKPRAIILMVPAGAAVDEQIAALRPLLDADDLIIDAGNANFHDTNRRAAEADAAGVPYLGIGVSGGEEGARHGPSIMGGGKKACWDRVSHILEAISAKYEGQPCATWMGEGGAGHFVKTVHNGIEYADMQLIAEGYGLLRDGLGMGAAECGKVFEAWNEGTLQSYLVEISGKVSQAIDPATGKPVLDIILDRAGQKGTGRWTVIESQQVGAPVPVIEAAVAARNMSAAVDTRKAGQDLFGAAPQALPEGAVTIEDLEAALIAGKIMCYAQGFALLDTAGATYGWSLPMPAIAEVWREGCIIRSSMLNDMASALREDPARNLMFAPYFADFMKKTHGALRKVVGASVAHGIPVPAMSAALGYFDTMRTARGTANMVQAQRDFFGAHSFERLDAEGAHHGPWGSHA
ncbi:6-phosphogluconate dehydrogenase, NADP(+)-dependent, decarboxylating [Pseudoruegeria aquimaris]|uniref:6-phosphogluconate dehydrogenase, decarboxylating n=1 Tax=Pseudoruegeria aquimaris TaxID=393663 RepID=A0A1Y5RGN1_9RHOB|nr:NADP-dependent phosphogluconate dehydrogenase [Pseudoruegeria aquimaris]SLN14237.1 6-phosphogluconate dehydrogenase, NADP(+)-dependent, decarboxylating [Pseudoruegeria aquimaris]